MRARRASGNRSPARRALTHPVLPEARSARQGGRRRGGPPPVLPGLVTARPGGRAEAKLGIRAIARKLNADHDAYPPLNGDTWTPAAVYEMLANPKYTGHKVWGRTTKKTGRKRPVPPDQWVWTPAPVHPAIISREEYERARQVTTNRAAISGDPGESAHPLAQRTYELRSRVRHRSCKRRMHGVTRATGVYYACPHDVTNPRHAAKAPGHPRTVLAREDALVPDNASPAAPGEAAPQATSSDLATSLWGSHPNCCSTDPG